MRKKNKVTDTMTDIVIKDNHTAVFQQMGTVEDAVKNVLVREKIVSLLPDCGMKDAAEEEYERAKRALKAELDTYVSWWSDYNHSLDFESERNTTKEWENHFPTAQKLLYQEVEKIFKK